MNLFDEADKILVDEEADTVLFVKGKEAVPFGYLLTLSIPLRYSFESYVALDFNGHDDGSGCFHRDRLQDVTTYAKRNHKLPSPGDGLRGFAVLDTVAYLAKYV